MEQENKQAEVVQEVVGETNSKKADVANNVNKAVGDIKNNLDSTPDTTGEYDETDIASNKVMAVLCYLGFLWLVPFFAAKDSPYVKFHLNQGLPVVLSELLLSGIIRPILVMLLRGVGSMIAGVIALAVLILVIIGIYNAATGKAKELPITGGIKILN